MKKIFTLVLALAMVSYLPAQNLKGMLKKAEKKAKEVTGGGGLSQEEVGKGLKEALDKGVGEAVSFLSAEDGYLKSPYKILLPEDAQKIIKK